MVELEKEFHNLVSVLKTNGYFISTSSKKKQYLSAYSEHRSDKNIMFGFCTINSVVFNVLRGRIAVFHMKSYSYENCMITLPIPRTDSQMKFFLDNLYFWENKSRNYCVSNRSKWVEDYPMQIKYDIK